MKQSFFFLLLLALGSILKPVTLLAQNWLITGNSGINSSINFLGTTDNRALILKTNSHEKI
jgi:hypothetical protein